MKPINKPPQADDAVKAGGHARDGELVPMRVSMPDTMAGLVCLADVPTEEVTWLWPARIPFGKITVLDGDPGNGKSTMTIDLAARITRGLAMPDGAGGAAPASVLFLTAEDGLGDTVHPRLAAAGGDPARVFVLATVPDDEGKPRPPALPQDIDTIARIVQAKGITFVVVDPLMSFLGGGIDSFKDHDIRRALHPLATMAEKTGVALLLVRHLNKGGSGNALYRGGGSIGIVGAARSGLLVSRDPKDDGRRVLATTKCNLAAEPPSLSYSLETDNGVGVIRWHGTSAYTAAQLVAQPLDPEERSQVDEAADLLRVMLEENGGEMPAADAKKRLHAAGIEPKTAQRARSRIGAVVAKASFSGKPVWRLPPSGQTQDGQAPTAAQPVQMGDAVQMGVSCNQKHLDGPPHGEVDQWTGTRAPARTQIPAPGAVDVADTSDPPAWEARS